uniref:Protein tweety homolog n=1 Tax=Plectus sambesii TaxID=2011161 RepID=A0A914XK28_9BILA
MDVEVEEERAGMSWLIAFLHGFPHVRFSFESVAAVFQPEDGKYREALIFWAAATLLLAALLLIVIIAVWVARCCSRSDQNVKSIRKVRNLSTLLFVVSIFCFISLGLCLFGNEHMNRGVSSAVDSVDDADRNIRLAEVQRQNLNLTNRNITAHLESLATLVKNSSATINETLFNETVVLFRNLSLSVDAVNSSLGQIAAVLTDLRFLRSANDWVERIEFERWVICASLLSIMIVVLFAGAVAFCRRNKKGTVVFSAFGVVIFLVSWMLLALMLALSLGLADYCAAPDPFLERHMSDSSRQTISFYRDCNVTGSHDNVPPAIAVGNVSNFLSQMQSTETSLEAVLQKIFNESAEMKNAVSLLAGDLSLSLKSVGALESTVSCYSFRDDMTRIHNGLCSEGIMGAFILLVSLLLIGVFLFILLLIVCRAWQLFTIRPTDYIEVDEDDPFFPRAHDTSTIPVDIYGTHVYNPRTRFANSIESDTENGRVGGDHETANTTTPLWQRNAPPPAVGQTSTNRSARGMDSIDVRLERFDV